MERWGSVGGLGRDGKAPDDLSDRDGGGLGTRRRLGKWRLEACRRRRLPVWPERKPSGPFACRLRLESRSLLPLVFYRPQLIACFPQQPGAFSLHVRPRFAPQATTAPDPSSSFSSALALTAPGQDASATSMAAPGPGSGGWAGRPVCGFSLWSSLLCRSFFYRPQICRLEFFVKKATTSNARAWPLFRVGPRPLGAPVDRRFQPVRPVAVRPSATTAPDSANSCGSAFAGACAEAGRIRHNVGGARPVDCQMGHDGLFLGFAF
jgi:hypothetical protein